MLRRSLIPQWLTAAILFTGLVSTFATSTPAAEPGPYVQDQGEALASGKQACGPNGCRPSGHDGGLAGGHAGGPGCRSGAPGCREWGYGQPDLFYNYYAPQACGGIGSYLYTSPGPIPQHVGHTYITYQPLMPHEFLYPHHRTYHRSYDEGRGLSRTSVHYYNPPVRQAMSGVGSMFKIAR